MKPKTRPGPIVAVLFCVAVGGGLWGCGESGGGTAPKSGEPVRPFEADLFGGGRIDLPGDAAGKVLVLRFWATWCAFCKDEMKAIEPVWQDLQGRGLNVLAINAGQTAAEIEPFLKTLGVTYPVVLDPGATISRAYGVTGLPMTFFVGRDGRVRQRVLGETSPAAFRTLAEGLL